MADIAYGVAEMTSDRPRCMGSDLPVDDTNNGHITQALGLLLPGYTQLCHGGIVFHGVMYTVTVIYELRQCVEKYTQMLKAWACTPLRPFGAFVQRNGQVSPFTDMDEALGNSHVADFFVSKHSGHDVLGVLVDPSAVPARNDSNWTTALTQLQGMHNKGLCFGRLPPDSFKCLSNGNVYVFGNYWQMCEQNVYMGLKWLLHADQGNKQISSLLHQLSLDRPLQDAPWQPTRWNQAQAAEAEMMQTNCLNTRGTMRGDTSWMQGTALAKCRQFLQNYDLACLRNHSRVNI